MKNCIIGKKYQHEFNFLTFATKILTEMKFDGSCVLVSGMLLY